MKRLTWLALVAAACAAAAEPVPEARARAAPLPEGCKVPLGAEGYPKEARRRGASAVVTAAFQINDQGEPDHVTLLSGAGGPFAAAAQQILRGTHCPAPAAQAEPTRYVLDIQFVLLPCRTPAPSPLAGSAVMICATRLK